MANLIGSLSRVQRELATLAEHLKELPCPLVNPIAVRPENNNLVVHEYEGWLACVGKNVRALTLRGADHITSLFGKRVDQESFRVLPEDARATATYFRTLFGSKHVKELSSYKKSDVRDLFMHVADLNWSDLEALFKEIKDEKVAKVRFLNEEETRQLRNELASTHSLEGLTKTALDALLRIYFPFEKVEHAFLNAVPTSKKFSSLRDMLFEKERTAKRVFVVHQMRELDSASPLWETYLGKELSSLGLHVGSLIPHADGIYRIFHEIKGDGAFKLLLKSYGSNFKLNILLYRGTVPTSWDSLKENACLPDIGMRGHKATLVETKSYLSEPSKGFVSVPHEPIHGIGYSKGGAQLALLARSPHVQTKFLQFTTICSPGISLESVAALAARFQTYKAPPRIRHIWENGDVIPEFGEAKPGINLDPSLAIVEQCTMFDEGEDDTCLKRMANSDRHIVQAALFVWNLTVWGHHTREVMGRDVRFKMISNRTINELDILDERLLGDSGWERLRKFAGATAAPYVALT